MKSTKKSKYVLATKTDEEILKKCETLEALSLSREDHKLVSLIKTQLEEDWRTPLLKKLKSLFEKYTK